MGAQPQYAASGALAGTVRDQFGLSEFDGYLRAAVTYGGAGNALQVFERQDDQLIVVGEVTGLAPGEEIYSTRFMGERGFMVTYPITTGMDPLFTLDLAAPTAPQQVGELEVPGFSTYLHPLSENHLIAVGQDGDLWGATGELALAVYDVGDLADPQRIHFYDTGDLGVTSEAQFDHHAFLYYPPDELLAIPMFYDADEIALSSIYAFHLNVADGFTLLADIDHSAFLGEPGSGTYVGLNLPRRSVVIGDYLYTISDLGVIVTRQSDWTNVSVIDLPWDNYPF